VWTCECDYVRIDVIALINGLAYEYVINSNKILEVEKVRKVVVYNISSTPYLGHVIKSRKAHLREDVNLGDSLTQKGSMISSEVNV